MKKTANTRPPKMETAYNSFRQKMYILNIDVNEKEDGTFEYESLTLPAGRFDKATIVSAIIDYRYPRQEMDAVVNNYLHTLSSGEENPKYIEEMKQMQAYRDWAKQYAEELLQS